jgi:hypothetical protein
MTLPFAVQVAGTSTLGKRRDPQLIEKKQQVYQHDVVLARESLQMQHRSMLLGACCCA